MPLFLTSTGYGVDVSRGFAAVARARRGPRGPAVEVLFAGDPAAEGGAWARARDALRAAGEARLALAAASLPAADAVTRPLTAPMASVRKARRVLPALLDVDLPFPLEACVVAFTGVARDRRAGGVRATALVARREAVDARLAELREAGVEPDALPHEGFCLWSRSVAEEPPDGPGLRVVAYLGTDRTAFAIGRGARFEAALGGRAAMPASPDAVPPDPGWTALAGRLARLLQSRAAPPGGVRVWWCGPLAARLDPAWRDRCLAWPGAAAPGEHREPASFLARALAAGAAGAAETGDLMPPGEPSACLDALRRRALARGAAAVAGAAALTVVLQAGGVQFVRLRAAQAERRVAALAREVTGLERIPRGFEAQRAREAAARREAALAPLGRLQAPSLTVRMASWLAGARRLGISFDTLELDGQTVSLRGAAPDWGACDRLAREVERAGYGVKVQRGEAGADERVPFALEGVRP